MRAPAITENAQPNKEEMEEMLGILATDEEQKGESFISRAREAKAAPEAFAILYCVLDDPSSTSEALRIKEQAVSAKIPGTSDPQVSHCKEIVEWARAEKSTFLRQRIEARLAALLMESKEYSEVLNLLSGLIKEVRRLYDKLLLVEIDLLESKLHFSLKNLPNAKAALTAARTAASAIYVPPAQQGVIDLQSGILHTKEKDYTTASSGCL
ncbi:hypothetical protein AgCh_036184 [Apium graveolens]